MTLIACCFIGGLTKTNIKNSKMILYGNCTRVANEAATIAKAIMAIFFGVSNSI